MILSILRLEGAVSLITHLAIGFAATMAAVVVIERVVYGLQLIRRRRIESRYAPVIARALHGDSGARETLVHCPSRHNLPVARLLIEPLIDDRDPHRIAMTRTIAQDMAVLELADRYLRSPFWWRRALALRALGLLQTRERTGAIIGALDDANAGVRSAALDALADLHDPASVSAIVMRLHDSSLPVGRRAAALAAFGAACEPIVLDVAQVDPEHLVNYARALIFCGTARSRAALHGWTRDRRPEVRAAAFEALAHVGLDHEGARLAIDALARDDVPVRAMAAQALRGWNDDSEAVAELARHLDDEWAVAVRAARSLQSMGKAGAVALGAFASRGDLPGLLARQMLWRADAALP